MAQDNIKNLYDALKGDYDLGSEDDFRNSLKDANNRRNLYNAIEGDYDLGSEEDFEKSLGYGNEANEPNTVTNTQQSLTQEEYGRLSPTAQEVAQGVGVAPNNGPNKPNEPNKADLQRVQEGMQRVQAREPKAQFVPEASNIVMATPTAETLKRYPWLKADEAVPFNRETGEPLYTWTDEQGRPISRSEIGIRTAKQEITGEREYMQQQPASLELPDSNARAMRLDGSLTEYVDVLMKEKYGDDYLNGTFTTADGRQVSGSELMTETAQQQYNELNNDINNARIEYLDADEGQRKELVDALSKKYQGLLTRESIERTMNDEQAQIEARETQRQRERQQIDEAYNKAYTDRAAVMQENARKAKEEYKNSSWLDRMFGGNPVQRAYWMNQNDKRIQIADTQINIALDARRVLDTGKAYDEGESWSGRLVRGMRDAMTDTGLYDGGVEEMHDLRNVKEAVDAYEAGTATDAQKDLLDTYSLLTMVNGENADALGGMYGAGQMTIQAIPFMAQMYINPIGSLGQSTMKAATRFGVRTFGRSMMNQYMKRLLTTSLKAGGRVTGDMLAAALPAMTFGAPAIGADMYDRLIGNVRGTRNEQGNVEYSGRDNAETSKAAAIAKSIGSNYLEYQSEMVGEYFRPLSNIISRGFGRATDKLGLGKVRDMIANISNKDFYRAYADFARRTQWQGTFNEYLEEVVNNVENALFIGDMDFSTDENGVFNLDTNIDTFLGVAVMSGFMSSLKTVDYIRTKGRLKDALDNAYTSGLDVFGTKEWQRITNEIDGLDDKTAASAVKKMLNNVDSDEKKRTIINYATAALANQGFNAGELKNSLEQVSDAAVNGGVPQDAIPGIENLAPEERQNVHVDGMIHAAVLYPTAENGQPQEVFITRGNVVMREDGTIDTEASDKEIYYKGVDGQVHIVSPDKLQAVAEPISVEDYVAANRPNEANEPDMAEEIVPGQVVNINVDGQTYQATVQGTDGNGNVSVYYQDANGMDRPATFTIDEIRNANRPNNEEPPVGGAGAVVESAEPNGTNEPNAPQAVDERTGSTESTGTQVVQPINDDSVGGSPVALSYLLENGKGTIESSGYFLHGVAAAFPELTAQIEEIRNRYLNEINPSPIEYANSGHKSIGEIRDLINSVYGEHGVDIFNRLLQNADGFVPRNGAVIGKEIEELTPISQAEQQRSAIPQDTEGNPIYDQAPVEATIADLYDGSLNDEEVQGFIDANINEAQKKYENVEKKAPKIGTNKAKYLEQKRKWQADVDEAKRVLDYWNEVNAQKESITHTTPQEIEAAQAELSGQNAREEYAAMNENVPTNAVAVASDFIRGAKITPESFRAETGYGAGEQRRFVGMIATEQNGGKSIDRLAEELVSYDNAELNGVTFNGDTSAAKDAILEALQSAGTRGELATDNTAEQERYVEARRAELDAQYMEAYGMTYEDYLAYEEQKLPEMLRKYANFDEVEYYNLYADEIERTLNASINEQGNDTAGEEPRVGGGNEVLPGERTDNARGNAGGTEQGTEVPTGVQGTVEDGVVSERTSKSSQRSGNVPERIEGVKETTEGLTKEDADNLLSAMEERAEFAPEIELTPANWEEQFGNDGMVDTPIGKVKMGENQIAKLFTKGRSSQFGMIRPTLTEPDVVVEVPSSLTEETNNDVERPTSLLFIKAFLKNDGSKVYYFKSVTVKKDGLEVSVSSHLDRKKRVEDALIKGKLLYRFDGGAQTEHRPADVSVTTPLAGQGASSKGNATIGDQSVSDMENGSLVSPQLASSESKDTQTSTNEQTIGEKFAQNEKEAEHEAELVSRVEVSDDDWQEGDNDKPTYKRSIIIDGKHTVTQVDQPDKDGHYTGSYFEFDNKRFGDIAEVVDYIDNGNTLASKIAQAEAETDTEPTEAQKEAGNYKKGHVRIGQFDITVETPKGSVRRGVDASGKAWEHTMRNTYGYIRGTEGVDGDHIDVFLTNDIDDWNGRRVYIVDQYNEDGTFDEHKVMLGFNDEADAQDAYLSNYEKGWSFKHKLVLSSVNLPDFEKWINSSHRKTKPFAEYKSVNKANVTNEPNALEAGFEIAPVQYTTKRGKVLDMFLVTFAEPLSKEQQRAARELAKAEKGWYDRDKGGFMIRSEESARKLADTITGNGEAVSDAQPLSLADTRKLEEPVMRQVDIEGLTDNLRRNGEARLSDHIVIGRPGLTEKATSRQTDNQTQEIEQQPQQSDDNGYGANNKLVSRDRYEELKKRMRQKLGGQLNMGIDPEILAIGTEMAAFHIEAGARKFADYARHMIDDLGDAIRPYLKSFYNGVRDLPEVQEAGYVDEMTPYDEVRTFDVANFDKPTINALDTAQMVVQEQEINKQAENAKNALTEQRNEKERQKRSRNKKKSVSSQQTPDLFGNVNAEQNQEDDNYGLQRNDGAVRAEGLPTDRGDTEEPSGSMGETVGQESGRPDRSGEESGSGELRRSLQQSERLDGQLTPRNRNNNHVERGTDYAPTTPKARYDANVEAVRLAKELTDSGQQATDEQKAILRQFSGWGGLGTFFNNERTRNELVALLGDDGYQQAAMSINSAYYTPSDVIDAMWDIVKNLGFKGGNILEGSAGIGNILGLMPMDISDRSNIEAVEIDGVSGMILKLLYPDAKVDIQGFENTQVRNGSVDLAITNVPFVTGLHVHDTTGDRDLSRRFGNIHDFCIAKNVRKLREGGIGVFISSSGTLDKSKALRDWVVNEGNADFIGAFRLNNKTFGGTTATSDIIVVRKRVNGNKSAGAINLLDTESVRTVSVPINDNGREKIKPVVLQYNKYFVEHPENMGGEMALNYERGETFRPEGIGLFPTTGINQEERMQQWAETFKDKAVDVSQPQAEEPADTQTDTNGNEIKDGTIVVGEDGSINVMYLGRQEPLGVNDKKVKGHTKAECVEDYNRIKRALNAVLEYETTNEKDDGLKPLLKELNDAYDSFKDKYGNLNKNTAISFLRNDIDFPSIQALEKFNETNDKDGKRIVQTEKTSIFTERVVQKEVEPHPTNVLDAVKTSVFRSGRIDLDYISNALGRDVSDIEKEIIDNGLGYRDPATGNMEVSYEYLSGNVRQKLAIAEANNEDGRYDKNIKALRKVMPMDIPAHLIEFTFGSSWVNPKLFSDYVNEKTGVPVTLTNVGGQWNMDLPYYTATEKNKSEGVRSEKLNKIVLGTDLMNAAINNRTITVSTTQRTWDGRTETITDKEATQACAAKIDDIRNDFKDWARAKMQSDPEMAKEIEQVYNERFNNYVPKTVTEEFMPDHFPGATKMINLYPHQKKAVIRATSQPLMLAHEVGTGKTFTLITTAMEMRRLGLARKPMIVVQNATVGQFVASAKELYPNAKVLTIADNERNEEGRKRFYAKIKYNDWDMIVVPQSVFERIPDSEERQMDFINDRIEEKEHVLEQIQEIDPKSMIARNAKRELDSLQTELAEVSDKKRQKDEKRAAKTRQNAAAKAQEQLDRATDDVENFDDMEIDAVLVDEAHEYKHLGFSTAMQRGVKGVDPSYSKKSAGVYLKTRAVMEKSNGKNVVFATGTPISNTAAEIWTFMRYLMPKHTMEEYGIYYFDDFVRNFGNLTQMLEFTTSGKFRENNRFSGYVNIPELIRIWSSVSDTVLTKETNLKDKLPETVDGGQKATDIYLPQSASLRSIMKAVRAELERFDNMSGKEKKENSAIPLVMYGIAKAAAIDPRLVMAEAADEPVSKTNRAVEETLKSLEATKDYKGTVAIFCDTYQNNQTGFNIYEEIKRKLVERGVPENQIVIMRSGMSVNKKAEIFDKVNAGDVRVIMGSTFTLGTGVNIQERLNTLIHLDAPNRPMDYTQRNGRILRQGNLHKQWGLPVKILRFGVEDSLDITAYQRLKTKGAIADSVMEGKKFINNNQQDRTLEEQEDVFGDTVAQLSGSEYALLKNQAERDFRKYNNKKKQYETDQIYVHNAIPRYEGQIKRSEDTIKQQQKALTTVEKAFPDGTVQEITIGNSKLSSQKAIGDYIKDVVNKKQTETEDNVRKGAQGTKASSSFTIKAGPFTFTVNTEYSKDTEFQNGSLFPIVHRNMTYSCDELGLSNVPVQRASFKNAVDDIMNNVLSGNDMRERIETENNSIERNRSELEQLKSREGKPFENEKELEDARKKVEEYTEKMRKEMEAKEQKYAEMDAQTQSADLGSLSGAEEAEEEELQRSGDGALTDDELSLANDPAAALTGRSTRTSAQRRRFAERERQRMVDAVQKLARKLNLDNVDIVTDTSTLQGRRARAKGFYSRSTGRITIVIPNHTDMRDVEQTLLHEAVAHYGLRQLFGEHFDTFLDNVYNNVDPELKRRIDAIAQRHGWSTRTATEEYLASLAENTNFEDMDANWWSKIKDYFLRMLHKIGFKDFDMWGEYLTDNELRYLLWRSYENLAEPGRYRSIIGEVRDIAKQHELNVGNYSSDTDVRSMSAENDDIRYREADEAEDDLDHEWQDEYDRRTLSAAFKFTEAAQDGMKSVSILQDIISKETGKPIKENENVWALQNRLSSTNKYEQDYFYENFYKPLMRTVGNLVKAGARYDELGRNMEDAQDDILKYLISKHGIERNAHFREVAAMEARQPYEESIEEIRKAVEEGEITRENADKQIEKLTEQANEAEEKSRIDTITRDYSGLSELYNNKMDFDALAEQYVSDFESKFDTADLWNKINAATKMTLRKTYEAGLISRSGYEATRDMYQYYIPLRGWSNDVASEMYNYKGQQGVGGRIMKRAKGRKSLAENPLAVIGRMGQDGILQANKNRVKQRLYNLAIGHDTSLLSISKQWYVNEGTKENPDWQRAYPELSGDMGADEVATALKEFDEKMKALKDEGMATQRRDGLTLKYHTTTAQEQQHRVNVSIGGREYNIYVNGNPRASQAINGELRMDEGDSSIVQRVNRWLANVYTSLNPEFVVTNYERDAGFAAAIVASTETPQYQAGWIKNMAKFNPLTTGVYINSLINKAMKGRVNPENITERYMQEFLANGGETGFTNMLTADDYKKLINKEIKNVNTGITARKAANVFNGAVQRANRVFEDATRFATYVTSREQGRSIDEAIRDAKEISLNFNTRGADGMRNDGIVHKFFRNLRHWVIFTNPSIQGLNKAGVAVRNHPVRSTIAIAGLPVLLGYGMAALASALLGDDDDEKVREAYMDLPKWVRRTNICIPIGGTKFVTIPLSYELRVSYGMGEMFWEIEQGLIEPGELAKETLTQIGDLLPLSFASGTVAQNVSPTIVRPLVDIIQNKDFTGRPIWRENTFNQNMPEYTKAYAGTAKWFTKSAEMLNNAIPKFWIKDYPSPDKYTPGALDINPAIVEHLFDNYLGGLYTFPAKAAKTISMIWDEDMRDVRNIPFINRNLKDSRSGNPINKSAGDRYNTYMREYRLSKQRWDGYRRETNHGVTDFLEKLTNFGNTPQGQRMFIIDGYKKSLDDIDKQIKDMGQYEGYGGDEERKRLKNISDSLKQELVNKLDSVSVVED